MALTRLRPNISIAVPRKNRRLLWIALGSGVLLLVTPLLLLPSLLRRRATSALEARTGLSAEIDAVSLHTHGATLKGLHLAPEKGDGIAVDIQQVEAKFGWFAALFGGTSAVESVHALDIDAEVDIASPAYAALRRKLSEKSESSDKPSGKSRAVEATRFALTVKDGKTELLVVDGNSAQLSAAEITSSLARVRANKPGLVQLALTDVDATLQRKPLQLSKVRVAEARVSIEKPVLPDPAHAKPEHDDDGDDATSDETPAKPQPVALASRAQSSQKSLQALLTKLAPDAVLELARARIEQVSGRQTQPILTDVAAELRMQAGGAVRVTGQGAAQTGGHLQMDMRFWPSDLRADGQVSLSDLPLTLFVPILPSVPWFEPDKSRIDAELTIKAESPARVSLDGYADLKNVSVSAARLATTPVQGIDFSIAGRGHWLPADRRLEIETGSLGLGKAKADVKGAVELASDHYAFDLAANMRPTPCTDAVRSIPSALLGDMSLAEWRGAIAAKLRFSTDSRELEKTVLSIDIQDRCGFEVVPVLADLSRFAHPFTHSVTEPDGQVFEMETGPGTDNWTPIESMSPYFVHAVMIHEDPQFFSHHGFSPINIRNALVRDLRERRYAVGASTISMQLVKNVFLHREKTLARKLQEVLLTWWTERVMEKRDILELYLNVIEYGPGIYGIRNAAQHYWNRQPSELSPAESVFLATILPNPKKSHTYFERNQVSASWTAQMRGFLKRLGERGAYDKEATDYGLQELEHFHFARGVQAAAPRTIAGAAAPLPYQQQLRDQMFDTSVAPKALN